MKLRPMVKKQMAREFRKKPTKSERLMWGKLRRNNFLGLSFRRQHVIKGFIVDFYCYKLKLVIEIDGGRHKYQLDNDIKRQKIIEENNIKFFRVKSEDVEYNAEEVLSRLSIFIKENLEYSACFKQ